MGQLTDDQQRKLNKTLTGFETQEEYDAAHKEEYQLPQMSREMWTWLYEGNFPVRPMPVMRLDLSLVASDIIDNVLKKNADYGDAWQALGEVGASARFLDKFFRIEKLANGQEALVVDEKIGDTIADLVGYGLLILLYKKFHGLPYDRTDVFKFAGA